MNRAAHATLASASCACGLSTVVNTRPYVQISLAQYRFKVKFSFFPPILTLKSTSHAVSMCLAGYSIPCTRSCVVTLLIRATMVNHLRFVRKLQRAKARAVPIGTSRPLRVNPLTTAEIFDFRFCTFRGLTRVGLIQTEQLFHGTVACTCGYAGIECQPVSSPRWDGSNI